MKESFKTQEIKYDFTKSVIKKEIFNLEETKSETNL